MSQQRKTGIHPSGSPPTKKSVPASNISPEVYNPASADPAKKIFSPYDKVARIGKETIFGVDLDYLLSTFYAQDLASPGATVSYLKEKALNHAISDSVILQGGEKLGLVDLNSDIFDNKDKNNDMRGKTIRDLREKLLNSEERISGEIISIWFHNQDMTSLPLPEAEAIAKNKIYDIYRRIQSGEITFIQAGDIVRKDTGLAQIDKNYIGNSYYEFIDKSASEGIFTFPELAKILSELKSGEMSPVIRHPIEGTPLGSSDEEFYAIIKINKLENAGAGSFYDWLKKEKQNYVITKY